MPLIFVLISLIPCVVNLSFSMWVAWCFHKHPRPPVWVISLLVIQGIVTFGLIFMAGPGFLIALLSSLSVVLCMVQALAFMCRRWIGGGARRAWMISSLVVLPLVIWIDLRFSVIVVDREGNPVEVDAGKIELQAQPRMAFYRGYGNRLKKGVVYFGFCQWVQHREKWTIWGDAISPEGVPLRAAKVSAKGDWGTWPLRVTVEARSP